MARSTRQGHRKQSSSRISGSYYTIIKGKKYDRSMLELADRLTKGRGDGRISTDDAKNLLRLVKDSSNYSTTEKQTMEYIRKHYKFTKEGDEFFRSEIRQWAGTKGNKQNQSQGKKKTEASEKNVAHIKPAQSSTTGNKRSSPWKEIFIALFLLLSIAAIFYFIVYRSGWIKSPEIKSTAVPVKNLGKVELSADLKNLVEKTQLLFIAEKSELTPNALEKITELATKLKNANGKIQITGHTCSLGPKSLNQLISEKRARVVKDALVARGVAADRIETRGAADSEPVGDNKTVSGRIANRRVTFKLAN